MNPIYEAPIEDRLRDLKCACKVALECLPLREAKPCEHSSLAPDEFAIGNWIVRPRFLAPERKKDPYEEALDRAFEQARQQQAKQWAQFRKMPLARKKTR